jgi:hypothetical protein
MFLIFYLFQTYVAIVLSSIEKVDLDESVEESQALGGHASARAVTWRRPAAMAP